MLEPTNKGEELSLRVNRDTASLAILALKLGGNPQETERRSEIMVQRCSYEFQSAWLGKDFGLSLAARLFPDLDISTLPHNKKGKNVGKCKCELVYIKVAEGGWNGADQRVENRVGKIIAAQIILRPWGGGKVEVFAGTGEESRLSNYSF